MTPKEKAIQIYNKFEDSISALEGSDWWESAKKCALVAVDELMEAFDYLRTDYADDFPTTWHYWKEVKEEIKNL